MKNISKYFKFKKFVFVCENEKDLKNIQDYLFSYGYKWESIFGNYIDINWTPPLVVKNFRYDDKIGNKYLIIDQLKWFNKHYENKKFNGDVYHTRDFLIKNKIEQIKNNVQKR